MKAFHELLDPVPNHMFVCHIKDKSSNQTCVLSAVQCPPLTLPYEIHTACLKKQGRSFGQHLLLMTCLRAATVLKTLLSLIAQSCLLP